MRTQVQIFYLDLVPGDSIKGVAKGEETGKPSHDGLVLWNLNPTGESGSQCKIWSSRESHPRGQGAGYLGINSHQPLVLAGMSQEYGKAGSVCHMGLHSASCIFFRASWGHSFNLIPPSKRPIARNQYMSFEWLVMIRNLCEMFSVVSNT